MSSYRCSWKRTKEGYEIRVAGYPKIKALARTFELALERAWEATVEATKDWEPHLALWPPRPIAEEHRHLTGDWLLVGGGEGAKASESIEPLFSKGVCPICRAGLGTRSAVPLAFPYGELEGNDIGYVEEAGRRGKAGMFRVISSEFATAFFSDKAIMSQLHKCRNTGRASKKVYYEVLATAPIKPVPIKHRRAEIRKCKACRRTGIISYYPVDGIPIFALKSDLDAITTPWAFLVTDLDFYDIIIHGANVNPLKKQAGMKGVTFKWLGIANKNDVFKKVPVRILTGEEWKL